MKEKMILLLSKNLNIESVGNESGERVICNAATGQRLKLSAETMKILQVFREARGEDAAARQLGINRNGRSMFRGIIHGLIRASILIDAAFPDSEQSALRRTLAADPFVKPAISFANCPFVCVPEIRGGLVFCGVPIDFATTGQPGTRFGPERLRSTSIRHIQYERDIFSLENRGWHEDHCGRTILGGVPVADIGDIAVLPSEAPQRTYTRCLRAARKLFRTGAIPIFLGGDHSISAPLVRACCETHSDTTVIHFDAHTDRTEWNPAAAHHHGNVMTRILAENTSVQLWQYGIRGFSGTPCPHERCRTVTQRSVDQNLPSILKTKIPRGQRCYLSIDIDVVDPAFAPGTGTPVPLGMTPTVLLDLLGAIIEHNTIVGIDLVELCPVLDRNDTTANLLFHTLMATLGMIEGGRPLA